MSNGEVRKIEPGDIVDVYLRSGRSLLKVKVFGALDDGTILVSWGATYTEHVAHVPAASIDWIER